MKHFNYDLYHNKLKIDKYSLDAGISEHAQYFNDIAEACSNAQAVRDTIKLEVEELYAELSLRIRSQAITEGVKLTEDAIKQKVTLDIQYILKQRELLDAKNQYDKLNALREAFSARGYMLRELAGLWIAGYFSDAVIASTDKTVDEVRYDIARAAIAEQRNSKPTPRRKTTRTE